MSWEHTRYEARCESCGHAGICTRSADDWGRSSTTWEGFIGNPPDPTAEGRKRVDARDMVPVCPCGATCIAVGKMLGV